MITVIAPAFYPDLYNVRYLAESAERHKVPVKWYGQGLPYKGWFDVQVDCLLNLIPEIPTSHVLYTDASDAFFCSDLVEITGKYLHMGEPKILVSQERSGVCAGGWLAEKTKICETLSVLKYFRPEDPDPDNPQVRWRKALESKIIGADSDVACDIFQVVDEPLQVKNGRIFNPRTVRYPSVVHFAGGYTDPVGGKAAQIEPYWRELRYAK